MWEALVTGIILGVSVSLLIGPLFLTILDTTIERGRIAGLTVATGIWVSDVILATGSFYGIRAFTEQLETQKLVGYAGSFVLMSIGLTLLFSRYKEMEADSYKYRGAGKHWLKGFVINTLNPFTIILWISLSTARIDTADTTGNRIVFYSGLLGVVAITDVVKVLIAGKIKPLLTIRGINVVRNISGAAICIFGVVLFVRTFLLG
jgi:threonine/homoserine/homoserine lactone efflux protein